MARNQVQNTAKATEPAVNHEQEARPDKLMPAETTIVTSPEANATGDATMPVNPDVPPAKKYRVANAREIPVLYDGCHSKMWPGKIVDSACYDVEHLRRQGVVLEEVG
jgi:hypothetical protein